MRQRDDEKDLDGIDTSLMIDTSRKRHSATVAASYIAKAMSHEVSEGHKKVKVSKSVDEEEAEF